MAKDGPSVVVKAALFLWQKTQFPLLAANSADEILKHSQNDKINDLAQWLIDRPFLESAFWLSSTYAILVGDDFRSEQSLYFTPPILAERLIENLITHGASLTNHIWMDPACGGGAFLAPVAVRMVEALSKKGVSPAKIVSHVSNNLIGNDVDETLVYLAKQFLAMALYEKSKALKIKPNFKISLGDGLLPTVCNGEKADVVICNPPYRKMKAEEVKKYANDFKDVIEGQPNIYGLFMWHSLALGKKHAVVGLLTPTSYLSGSYFSKLRTAILETADVCQLDMVDDRIGVFIGVSQGALLSVFMRNAKRKRSPFTTKVCALSKDGKFTLVGNCSLTNRIGAWAVPRQPGDEEILRQAATSPHRLKDFGYVARIGTYVDYRDQRKTYIDRPKNAKKNAVFPILWSSDITSEGVVIHGRTSKEDSHHKFIGMETSDHPSIIRRPVIAMQRVTSSDQPRRLVCASINEEFMELHGGVVGENHVILLEKISDTTEITTVEFAAILMSKTIDRLFRCISGAVNVSVSELNQLALPSPNILSKYIREGRDINAAVLRAYGM